MKDHRERLSIQIIFGAFFLLIAGFIAFNFTTILQWSQNTINALLFALFAMFLLKDGVPNFILGLKEYFTKENPTGENPKKANILED